MKDTTREIKPPVVALEPKQGGEIRARWAWVEPAAWSERMLTTLETGIIDQYQTGTDPRSGIETDPNRMDDEQYIARLIGQVITVSVETVKIVKSLPELAFSK